MFSLDVADASLFYSFILLDFLLFLLAFFFFLIFFNLVIKNVWAEQNKFNNIWSSKSAIFVLTEHPFKLKISWLV